MITNNPHNFLQYSHLVGNCLTNLSYSTLLGGGDGEQNDGVLENTKPCKTKRPRQAMVSDILKGIRTFIQIITKDFFFQ